ADADAQLRRSGVIKKYDIVRHRYAPVAWLRLQDGSCVPAIDDCGVVVFPGPPGSEEWFSADDGFLLPLCPDPGGGVLDPHRTGRRLEALLDRLRAGAAASWRPS